MIKATANAKTCLNDIDILGTLEDICAEACSIIGAIYFSFFSDEERAEAELFKEVVTASINDEEFWDAALKSVYTSIDH